MTAAAVAGRIAAVTVGFAMLHSLLASHAAKATAAKLLGPRTRNGLYRVFFNAQAAATSAILARYILQLPDRELYVIPRPLAWLMRAGQTAGLLLLLNGARKVGILRIVGVSSVASLTRGDGTVAAEPEAQGPSLTEGGLNTRGAFLRSRHPLNLAGLPILWLNPRMTRNLAIFSALASVYFWLGSWHEERRLAVAYGGAYRRYVQSGVPFFFGIRTLTASANSAHSSEHSHSFSHNPQDS